MTMTRVNLLSNFNPVDYATIERINRRSKNAKFMFLIPGFGEEQMLTAAQLAEVLSPADFNKVLSERGNFAIIDNILISILED